MIEHCYLLTWYVLYIYNSTYDENDILSKIKIALSLKEFNGENIYCQNKTIELIVKELKTVHETL